MEKQWKQWQTIFLGSRISADGDCSHEIKRCLLLGRKVMTNLDSIFKSRDITWPTKICLVKAMIFPVVMYGCESWTIKKAECRRIDAFELWCWRRLLRVPWTARKSNQFILKEISPGCSLEGVMLKLKLQYFGHLMWRADSFEKTLMLGKIEGRRRRGRQRIRWLDGIPDLMDNGVRTMEFEWTLGVGDEKGGLACCSSWGRKESDTTDWLNWTELSTIKKFIPGTWWRCGAKSLQSCPTLSDPMDCSPLGSSVQGILQARILEWVAISPSRESSKQRDWTCFSCIAGGFFTTEPPGKPLSGGPVVKTPPSNAEGACLIPGLGNKVLHAAEWGQNFFNNNKI